MSEANEAYPRAPGSAFRVGQALYCVSVDDITGKCEMQTWIVRTIRAGKVTAIWKDSTTWVKRSSRNFDWGWADSIDPLWRKTWPDGDRPETLATTRRGAWKTCLATARRYKASGRFWEAGVAETVERTAQRMMKPNNRITQNDNS